MIRSRFEQNLQCSCTRYSQSRCGTGFLLVATTRGAARTITAVAVAAMAIALRALATTRTCINRAFGRIGLIQAIKRNLSCLRIDFDDFNLNNIAQVQDVFDLSYAAVCHTGNVKKAVFA